MLEKRKQEMKEVLFQIHPSNELPLILKDSSLSKDRDSLTLIAGNEYFIELTPFKQSVTSNFKSMTQEDRHCLLSNEVSPQSKLKVYAKQNCRFVCKVHKALENCGCIAWDFPINITEPIEECDVFGRTCFYNSMKEPIDDDRNQCQQCRDDCEFITYHKTHVTTKEKYLYNSIETQFYPNLQQVTHVNSKEPCTPKYLCEYLIDVNNTIEALTWYEELEDTLDELDGRPKRSIMSKKRRANSFLREHIVVHIDFASSKVEMNVLDARWSFMDRIAKLGGTLGMCTQITGGTLLTIIHLLVLIIKACFNY